MVNLNNWKEITKGLYRYVISANVAYEIHILKWYHDTDILTAKASLYIVGEWTSNDKEERLYFTERECLLAERTVEQCLEESLSDFVEHTTVTVFQVGKYYKHIGTRELLHIIGEVETTLYGNCLVGESTNQTNLVPIGKGEGYAQNYVKIEKEEWDRYFKVCDDKSTETTEMVNVYGKWVPKKDVTNNSNYNNASFNGECN